MTKRTKTARTEQPTAEAPAVTEQPATEQPGTEQPTAEAPTAPAAPEVMEEAAPEVRMFRPDEVIPWPGLNPRTHFDADEQAELDASVKTNGVRQPGLVHLNETAPHFLIVGERRWRSCGNTGRMFPAVVGTFAEAEAFELALVENIQRSDLTPIEEGRGFRRWLDQHPGQNEYTLAERINKSQPYISMRLNLLRLPEPVQELVAEGLVTGTQARDAFLPFASIPEEPRAQVFASVHDQIRAHFANREAERLNLSTLKAMIGGAALKVSKPLTPADADHSEERPLFDGADHDRRCKCNGPAWMYKNWGNPQRRCFRAEWWDRRQEAARRLIEKEDEERRAEAAKRREEEERRAAKARREEEKKRAAQPQPEPVQDPRRLFPEAVPLADSTTDFRTLRLLVDPALIPAEALQVVKNFEPYAAAYTLVCTTREALQEATRQARHARVTLVERMHAERIAAERAEASRLDLRKPEAIAELLTALPTLGGGYLHRLATEHGFEGVPNTQPVQRDAWLAMDGKALQLFARVVVVRLRSETPETRGVDVIDSEAKRILREQYEASLAALRPGLNLPGPAYVEQMEAAVSRFYEAHGPLAQQVRDGTLSEAAGEAIQALAGIVQEVRTLRTNGLTAGVDAAALRTEDVEERFAALEDAYRSLHAAQEEEPQEGAEPEAPAPAEEEPTTPAPEEPAGPLAEEEAPTPTAEAPTESAAQEEPTGATTEEPPATKGEASTGPAPEEEPAPTRGKAKGPRQRGRGRRGAAAGA